MGDEYVLSFGRVCEPVFINEQPTWNVIVSVEWESLCWYRLFMRSLRGNFSVYCMRYLTTAYSSLASSLYIARTTKSVRSGPWQRIERGWVSNHNLIHLAKLQGRVLITTESYTVIKVLHLCMDVHHRWAIESGIKTITRVLDSVSVRVGWLVTWCGGSSTVSLSCEYVD